MFLVFKDSTLGEVRVALSCIVSYYVRNEYVVMNTTDSTPLRTKEHTIEQIDSAISEGYCYIKTIPRIKTNG